MRLLRMARLSTSPIPRWLKVIVTVALAIMPLSATLQAQSITLDSLGTYEASYRTFMVQKWKADRKEFTITTRKKWWYYLPSPGWSFRSPSISLNTGVIAQIDRDKLTLAARLEALDARYQVEYTETLARISTEYRKLVVRSEQLDRERRLLAKLLAIQRINDEAFNKQQLSPQDHLQVSYEYERAVSEFRRKESELAITALDFFSLCRFNLPTKQLIDVASSDPCPASTDRDFSLTVASDVPIRPTTR
ncbi:hypothetical protein [Fibrella forsythiae]|uniref:Outer membrane efflux protein n=1 Tax=Fibrella forsythiae TaxID=2817061 RepID=A0ABS3JLL6_9BACT|nr:hypothetical protein [Fibrella forsythiae]MBO0950901.1 hypothetical protein [Fibrella forsythiae]